MASNRLPDKLDDLETLAEDMADGLHTHEVAVGILQNTEARFRPVMVALQLGQQNYLTAKSTKRTRTTTQTVKDSNGKAFIGRTRAVLIPYLGTDWSEAWAPTGFPNQSTAVPSKIAERQSLLLSLQGYLNATPAHENSPLGVTATAAGALFAELSDARSAVNQALFELNQKKSVRDAAEVALRRRMRGLIDELTELLAADDPLWYAFGLVPPALLDTPDATDTIEITGGAPGSLFVNWPDASRATSYFVEIQIVGVDADFHRVRTVSESEVLLTDLPTGATVRIRIISVNAEGDTSEPSEVAEHVVP